MSIIYYQPFIIGKQFFAAIGAPPQSTVGALLLASSVVLILILTNDFKSEWMSLSEHNLGLLILKSNIRAILIIQMSENVPGTFIMDCFVLPRSQDTCNNVYHHETHRHKQSPSLLHRTKATDLLRTCVIAVFSLDNVNPLSVSLAVIATPGLIRDV